MQVPACTSLEEVRERIDALDRQMVPLLAERFAYARQAASFKSSAAEVPAPARAEQVVANARALARSHGASEAAVEQVYRAMIGAMVALELQESHLGASKR
jgi:isochorismate pyruvate lyase